MKRKILLSIAIFLCLIQFGSFRPSSPLPQVYQTGNIDVHIYKANLYKEIFTEPFETVAIFFYDGDLITMTGQYELIIPIPPNWFIYLLKSLNKDIKNALFIIHNHNRPAPFSPGDIGFYRKMKESGFNGLFMIYYPFNEKVIVYEDKLKK